MPERYDAEGDKVQYQFLGLPPGVSYDPGTLTVRGVPTTAGTYTVTVYSGDDYGATTNSQFVSEVPMTTAILENRGHWTYTLWEEHSAPCFCAYHLGEAHSDSCFFHPHLVISR